MKSLSVIIPALNEEGYLGETLQAVHAAIRNLDAPSQRKVQIIVVDNDSTDQTPEIARGLGATVIAEPVRNIARARNAGARAAQGDLLFFLDADTLIPPSLFSRIAMEMSDPVHIGGAVDVLHRPASAVLRAYVWFWRIFSRPLGMAQGAAQFCDRETFSDLGGYDESIDMGEDVDFYWRLTKTAGTRDRDVCYISDLQVIPSPRRFDNWPLWKTLLWTNPIMAAFFLRNKRTWRGWYEVAPR